MAPQRQSPIHYRHRGRMRPHSEHHPAATGPCSETDLELKMNSRDEHTTVGKTGEEHQALSVPSGDSATLLLSRRCHRGIAGAIPRSETATPVPVAVDGAAALATAKRTPPTCSSKGAGSQDGVLLKGFTGMRLEAMLSLFTNALPHNHPLLPSSCAVDVKRSQEGIAITLCA